MKKIYIAGPMRGYSKYNFPMFDRARDLAASRGWNPISPADLDRNDGAKDEDLPENAEDANGQHTGTRLEVVKRDLGAVFECQAILLLPNWEKSAGATAELAVAEWLELEIYHYDPDKHEIISLSGW